MPMQKEFIGASDHLFNRISFNIQEILSDHGLGLLDNIITEELNDLEEALEDKIKTPEEIVYLKKYKKIIALADDFVDGQQEEFVLSLFHILNSNGDDALDIIDHDDDCYHVCPNCHETYDDADEDFYICHLCGFDANEYFEKQKQPMEVE